MKSLVTTNATLDRNLEQKSIFAKVNLMVLTKLIANDIEGRKNQIIAKVII